METIGSVPVRRRSGRPTQSEVAELEERLREAALELFLDRGYDGTTMEAVATAAGITRRTLYARHPDKRALFVSVITQARERLAWDRPDFDADFSDLSGALTAIARSAVARAVNSDQVRLNRIVMTESQRFPELVMFAGSAPMSPRIEAVAALLRRHQAAGAIRVENPEMSAEQFLAMVSLVPARLAAVGVLRPPDVEQRYVDNAVALFVRAVRT